MQLFIVFFSPQKSRITWERRSAGRANRQTQPLIEFSSEDMWFWLKNFEIQNCSMLDRGRGRKTGWRYCVLSQIPSGAFSDWVGVQRCRQNASPRKRRWLEQRSLNSSSCHASSIYHGSEQPDIETYNDSLSHQLRREWVGKQAEHASKASSV